MDVPQSQPQVTMPPTRRLSAGIQWRDYTGYLFVAPMLIFIIVMLGYPIFFNIQMSFYDVTVATFRAGNAAYVGLDNYVKLLNDPAFLKAVVLSLTFTVMSIQLQFLI